MNNHQPSGFTSPAGYVSATPEWRVSCQNDDHTSPRVDVSSIRKSGVAERSLNKSLQVFSCSQTTHKHTVPTQLSSVLPNQSTRQARRRLWGNASSYKDTTVCGTELTFAILALWSVRLDQPWGVSQQAAILPWLLHQLLPPGSCPVWVPIMTSFSVEQWWGSVSPINPFLPHGVSSKQ